MPGVRFRLLAACAVALSLPALAAVAGTVTQTNIVANDASFKALVTDPTLVNPWGISTEPGGPFWLSDNGTGISPVYSVAGSKLLTVTIPPPAGKSGPSAPTGQVFNSATSDFVLSNKKPAAFIFDTEDGTISGWNGGSSAVLAVDNSASGAVYKGLALAPVSTIAYLLATNFHAGVVEVYNGSFQLVSTYRSPKLPKLYAPFNVAVLGANIFVTYALQDALKHDDVPGKGHGYLDQVTLNSKGKLKFMRRIQANGPLNSPWGLAIAPASFGTQLGGALLVGNFGNGAINAYNVTSGALIGPLMATARKPLVIDGLWSLFPGNGGSGGSASDIYFTAGPNGEADGLFGSLSFSATAGDLGE